MTKENIFFDLDGTIINSMEGIFNAINYVTASYGLDDLSFSELKAFIGPPIHLSFKKAFNADFETADKYVRKFREYYTKQGVLEFSLYDGIEDTIKLLSEKYNIYVTTSKAYDQATKILESKNLLSYFRFLSGSYPNNPDSTKLQVLNEAIAKFDLIKESCLLIGDTGYDGEGAQLCGIDFYGVSYGFGTDEELLKYNPKKIFKTPTEISDYFMR